MTIKRSPELQAVFDAIERAGPYTSIEEVNRLLSAHMLDYNARAQPALGGLSPNAMSHLLYGDWVSQGALLLDEGLSHEDLAGVAILADARSLLEYVRDEGPVKETTARNLPRAVVAALLPHLRMSGGITPRARALLSQERAGELYALLFRTLFRELDLRVLDYSGRHEKLQSTLPFSFYKLRSSARAWASAETLAQTAWLDSAKDPLTEWEAANVDFRHFSFQRRVLDPLVQFGLLECRQLPSEEPLRETTEYRCAPLFNRFMRFDFTST